MHPLRRRPRTAADRTTSALATLGVFAGLAGPAAAAPLPDRVWGTYYGGPSSVFEWVQGSAIDAAGNLYIVGETNAKTGIATPGAHKSNPNSLDVFVMKFAPDGTLTWGTYFGGEHDDRASGIAVGDDALVIVGSTLSETQISTPGAFQEVYDVPLPEVGCFAASFTLDGVLTWGTYVSSPQGGGPVTAAIDDEGGVYLAGNAGGPIPGLATPGVHQEVFGGGGDAFLARFDAQGQRQWGTYYGGAPAGRFTSVALGAAGEVYVAGTVSEYDAAIASAGAHQTTYGGGFHDAFLARFHDDGTRAWGTYYGGELAEAAPRLAALPQGGVVLAAGAASTTGLATAGAHLEAPPGQENIILARFDAAGTRLWGTYYGGDAYEEIASVTTDALGAVYLCGRSYSSGSFATPGAWMTAPDGVLGAAGQLFTAKFGDDGAPRWSTYFGSASTTWEQCTGIEVDANLRVYVSGHTQKDGGIATPGAHDTSVAPGDRDGYLMQLSQGLGQPCAGPADCGNGLCVDGMCCDAACGDGADDCQACSVAAGGAVDGVCTRLGAAVTCRAAEGACDVAEHCSGVADECPADVHAPDGSACEDGLCSAGVCTPMGEGTTTEGSATEGSTTEESTTEGSTTESVTTEGSTTESVTTEGSTTESVTTEGSTTESVTTEGSTTAGSTTAGSTTVLTTEASPTDASSSAGTGDAAASGDSAATGDEAPGASGAGDGSGSDGGEDALQQDGAGCGCRSDGGSGLLGLPLWLLVRRRRR